MNTFTIDGSEYVPFNDRLYKITEEVTNIDDLEESQSYLHEDSIGTFELKTKSYESFDAIFRPHDSPDIKKYYTIEDTGHLGDEFTSALRLSSLTPNNIEQCPNCEGWAGEKDDPETPKCYTCGYGTDDGVRDEWEESA